MSSKMLCQVGLTVSTGCGMIKYKVVELDLMSIANRDQDKRQPKEDNVSLLCRHEWEDEPQGHRDGYEVSLRCKKCDALHREAVMFRDTRADPQVDSKAHQEAKVPGK